MKATVKEINGKRFLLLPDEISSSELEVFKLRDGFYLLTVQLGQPKKQPKKQPEPQEELSEEEKQLLIDLSLIRFEHRTLVNVKKALSRRQLNLLKNLIKRGYVSILRKGKYKDVGVLSFTDEVFAMLKEEKRKMRESAEKQEPQTQTGFHPTKPFFVLGKHMRKEINELVAKGYLAVVGMDGRVYAARPRDFSVLSNKIKKALRKEEKSADEIARELGEDREAVYVVLRILWARGEAVEARRDVFMLVE